MKYLSISLGPLAHAGMYVLDSDNGSDDEPTSKEMLEDICDDSQSHPNINRIEARHKMRDRIKQRQSEWKGALKATQNMGKGLYKVFTIVVKEISKYLLFLGENVSEVSHFISEPINFAEVTKFSYSIKKPRLKENLKEIKNLINNQTFLFQEPDNGYPVTSGMDVYKANIQSNGSLDKLKLKIVVRGDLQNKELFRDTWSPKASMRNLKDLLVDAANHKAIFQKLDFI